MFSLSCFIALKDLKLVLRNKNTIIQAVLLSLLIIFLFSFSRDLNSLVSSLEAATIFWIGTLFSSILIFNQLYGIEMEKNGRLYLILMADPVQSVWLGKLLSALLFLLFSQLCFFPATLVFFNLSVSAAALIWPLCGVLLGDLGICVLGSLMGAITQEQSGRDTLLAILLFPLLSPILLAAINLFAVIYGEIPAKGALWAGLGFAFDAIYIAVSLLVFPFLYRG